MKPVLSMNPAAGWGGWFLLALAFVSTGCASAYRSGHVAMRDGRYVEAASRFTEALAEAPDRVEVLVSLGVAHYRAGLYRTAIGPLGRAVLLEPDRPDARAYLALTYLALEEQAAAERQLGALLGLTAHPRIVAQARRAIALLQSGALPTDVREFVRYSLEDELAWQEEVLEARLAPHMYFGPAWFVGDSAGWHPLGLYPYGVLRP